MRTFILGTYCIRDLFDRRTEQNILNAWVRKKFGKGI